PPIDPDRAKTERLRRDVIVVKALGDVEDPLARELEPLERYLEVAWTRLVGTDLLGRDGPFEAHAQPPFGCRKQVVVAIRDDTEPEALFQPGERRWRIGERWPVGDGATKGGDLIVRWRDHSV